MYYLYVFANIVWMTVEFYVSQLITQSVQLANCIIEVNSECHDQLFHNASKWSNRTLSTLSNDDLHNILS